MSHYGHNSTAFDNWYINGPYETWWCEPCQEAHAGDEECEVAERYYAAVKASGFGDNLAATLVEDEDFNGASGVGVGDIPGLISDDAVDMSIYLATHSVNASDLSAEVNEK